MNDRRTPKTWLRRASLGVALLAGPSPLLAPHVSVPAAHAEDRKALEGQARKAFTAGEYEKALGIYVDLFDETHHPTYLRNIARCHQNLGHADKAIAGFREYLRKAKSLTPEQQTEIEGFIAEMEELKKKEAAAASATPPAGDARATPTTTTTRLAPDAPRAHDHEVSHASETSTASPSPGVDLRAHATPPPSGNDGDEASPFYTRAWFWVGVGVLAAGAATTAILLSRDRGAAGGNLGTTTVPGSQP